MGAIEAKGISQRLIPRPATKIVCDLLSRALRVNAACSASISMPHHGHQNGPQQRGIRLLPPPILLGIIVAKDHIMVD